MKCNRCGRTLDAEKGERAFICSCCNEIVCFGCEQKDIEDTRKKLFSDDHGKQEGEEKERNRR